jgi:hypothetical protein
VFSLTEIFNKKKSLKGQGLVLPYNNNLIIFIKMGIALKFVEKTTSRGNLIKEAKINGTLKRLSDKVFDYDVENEKGKTEKVEYKLATVEFLDENQQKHVANNVHVYKKSYEQDMEVGSTYLGSVTRSKNADGSPRSPWWALSSLVIGAEITDDMFEEVEETSKILNL